MDHLYIFIIAALLILAIADLIVGVSNDAVNFLNSAVGSKALSFRAIIITASIGIAIGAVFSSGLMEVARKGIFVPQAFSFNEIMILFLAVMLTDILLLDFFNTLGLPTSTTVSIVFELLGSAVVMALIKITANEAETIQNIANYINTSKAQEIILGIFLSIAIAFSIGALVQYIARLLLTFQFEKKPTYTGALFGGIALTAITYFIIIKGFKETPFYSNIKPFIEGKTGWITFISFLFWTAFSFLSSTVFKSNIYKLIIFAGTFALALAFAGNDLINFIGVPLAALQSYQAWSGSGLSPELFYMDILAEPVESPALLLFVSGMIMVLTLWFSTKAQKVLQTSIDLSDEGQINERFQPNFLSRILVRSFMRASDVFMAIMPQKIKEYIEKQFEKSPRPVVSRRKTKDLPAFDMVRAAVNLMVASVLISIATSLKLPLSTTYVTFMVAMGTSLSDRAWGSESAVYRVAGVLNVIGGWFVTAICAFIVAGIVAFLLHLGGPTMIAVLFLLVLVMLGRNTIKIVKRNKEIRAEDTLFVAESSSLQGVIEESSDNISKALKRVTKINENTINGLIKRDLSGLKKSKRTVVKLESEIEDLQSNIFYFIKNLETPFVSASKFYIDVIICLRDISQSLSFISRISHKHINNNHKSLKRNQAKELKEIQVNLNQHFLSTRDVFRNSEFENIPELMKGFQKLLGDVKEYIHVQVGRTRDTESSPKNTTLYFSILLEMDDLITTSMELLNIYLEHKELIIKNETLIS